MKNARFFSTTEAAPLPNVRVGYKELFQYLDGNWTLDFAIEKIKQNSRKQMTRLKTDEEIAWFSPSEIDLIFNP